MCTITPIQAQWEAPLSQYWEVKNYYNPSFAGSTNNIGTSALYRYQWAGIENSPLRAIITADMPFKLLNRLHGAGLTAYTSNTGSYRNTLLAAQYNFKQNIGQGTLNIGIQAGIFNLTYDEGNLNIATDSLQTNKKQINVNTTDKQVANLTAGISWTSIQSYVGISLMHINQPEFYTESYNTASIITDPYNTNPYNTESFNSDSINSKIPLTYNFLAGYNIALFYPLEIQPMIRVQHNSVQTQAQATIRMEYNKKVSGGISWITENGYSFFAGTVIEGFKLGYAYSKHNKGIGKESNGSHELYIKYNFPLNIFKTRLQPQKSIRLL